MKKLRIVLIISIILILMIITTYYFRLDRFGFQQISWVDCIQVDSNKYYSDFKRVPIEIDLVDKKIGEVKFNISDNVHNENYKFRNLDATLLSVGTEIYNLKSNNNSISVKIDDKYYIYKLDNR